MGLTANCLCKFINRICNRKFCDYFFIKYKKICTFFCPGGYWPVDIYWMNKFSDQYQGSSLMSYYILVYIKDQNYSKMTGSERKPC